MIIYFANVKSNPSVQYSTLWTLNSEPANHQYKTTAVVHADRANKQSYCLLESSRVLMI